MAKPRCDWSRRDGRRNDVPKTTPVSEVMTTTVQTAGVGDSLSKVRSMVADGHFHHVPILNGTKLVGMISSRDLVQIYRYIAPNGSSSSEFDLADEPSIANSMTTDLVTMRADESIEKAINTLGDGRVHSIVVLDEQDILVGIVTNIDLLEYLFA
jgi:CBS domain-containing membrane protein